MSNIVALRRNAVNPDRWTASITYRSERGPAVVQYQFEELEDLHQIVEAGPDWHTIEFIDVRLTNNRNPDMTVEKAETQ